MSYSGSMFDRGRSFVFVFMQAPYGRSEISDFQLIEIIVKFFVYRWPKRRWGRISSTAVENHNMCKIQSMNR